jgi:hypothetical protein
LLTLFIYKVEDGAHFALDRLRRSGGLTLRTEEVPMKNARRAASSNSKATPSLRAARDAEISHLRDAAEESLVSRERFRERALLVEVYDLYLRWVKDRLPKKRAQQLIKFYKPRVRANAHPITVIIAATVTQQDQKIRSKWSLALQYAHANNVAPEDLGDFMDQNGGMAGCAQAFGDLGKKKGRASKSNKKAKTRSR